jgi:hypothetical protein
LWRNEDLPAIHPDDPLHNDSLPQAKPFHRRVVVPLRSHRTGRDSASHSMIARWHKKHRSKTLTCILHSPISRTQWPGTQISTTARLTRGHLYTHHQRGSDKVEIPGLAPKRPPRNSPLGLDSAPTRSHARYEDPSTSLETLLCIS